MITQYGAGTNVEAKIPSVRVLHFPAVRIL
jgi:hypothetical protein